MINLIYLYILVGVIFAARGYFTQLKNKKLHFVTLFFFTLFLIATWPIRIITRVISKKVYRQETTYPSNTSSIFKKWINTNIDSLSKAEVINEELIFGSIIQVICEFDLESSQTIIPETKLQEDLCFFELGCFLYTHYNLQLLINDANVSKTFSLRQFFRKNFASISQGLNFESDNSIEEIIEKRIMFYEVIYLDADMETSINILSEILFQTNKKSQIIKDLDNRLPIIDFEFSFFKQDLYLWNKHFMPVVFNSLGKYIEKEIN